MHPDYHSWSDANSCWTKGTGTSDHARREDESKRSRGRRLQLARRCGRKWVHLESKGLTLWRSPVCLLRMQGKLSKVYFKVVHILTLRTKATKIGKKYHNSHYVLTVISNIKKTVGYFFECCGLLIILSELYFYRKSLVSLYRSSQRYWDQKHCEIVCYFLTSRNILKLLSLSDSLKKANKPRWHYGFRDWILLLCVLHVLLKVQDISRG